MSVADTQKFIQFLLETNVKVKINSKNNAPKCRALNSENVVLIGWSKFYPSFSDIFLLMRSVILIITLANSHDIECSYVSEQSHKVYLIRIRGRRRR